MPILKRMETAWRVDCGYDGSVKHRGTIYFDAGCGLCSAGARRWQRLVEQRGFTLTPLQSLEAERILGLAPGALPGEVKLQTHNGAVLGGVDALAYVARYVWWGFPFHLLATIPPIRDLLRLAYLPVARHRQSISRVCKLRPMTNPR